MPDRSGAARTPCVRIPADVVGDRPGRCPMHRRASVDHAVRRPGRHKPEPLCTDPLTALGAALDLVELGGRTVEEACAHLPRPGERPRDHLGTPLAPLHEGLLTWVEHAVRTWVRALEDLPGPARIPCAQPWLLRFPPRGGSAQARTYEVLAGGRGYTFLEGAERVRELRVPVVDALAEGPPDPADAVAAHVLAAGTPVDRPAMGAEPWRHRGGLPLPVRGEVPPPDRVRLLQVSCADGSEGLRFEGTPAEAEHLYRARGRPALRTVPRQGEPRVPGPDCGPCKLQRGCEAPARVPGLLGFRDRSRPRRTWSVGTGLRHRACPASAHLHELGLPGQPPSQEEVVRSHLARAHARRQACSEEPDPATDPHLARLLTAHARDCPLHTVPASAPVHAGLSLPVQDPLADVLVLARVDLLHLDGVSWVQRQAVLADPVPEPDGPSLLAAHPALAMSVLLFACGVITPGPRSRVELEILTADGPEVHTLDPFSPGLRSRAHAVVSELASPWHQDTAHAPTPGPACASCLHRRWCPESPEP